MSMLSCPLCGKQNSLRYFSPENLSKEDIQAVEIRGLGRARGFEVVGRPSILDDEALMARIAKRCSTILKIIEGESPKDVDAEELQNLIDEYEQERDQGLSTINEALPDTHENHIDLEEAITAICTEYRDTVEELADVLL